MLMKNQSRNKKILVASFAAVLIVIGITTLVLALIPVRHGLGFTSANVRDQIKDIGVSRGTGDETTLYLDDRQNYFITNADAKDEIIRLLERGSRTNRLSETFRRSRPRQVGQPSTTLASIISQSDNQLLHITFINSPFAIRRVGGILEFGSSVDARPYEIVHHIFIPLNNIRPYWQQQTWFMATSSGQPNFVEFNLRIMGNFRGLYNFLLGENAVNLT